jgi:hypothetical protein
MFNCHNNLRLIALTSFGFFGVTVPVAVAQGRMGAQAPMAHAQSAPMSRSSQVSRSSGFRSSSSATRFASSPSSRSLQSSASSFSHQSATQRFSQSSTRELGHLSSIRSGEWDHSRRSTEATRGLQTSNRAKGLSTFSSKDTRGTPRTTLRSVEAGAHQVGSRSAAVPGKPATGPLTSTSTGADRTTFLPKTAQDLFFERDLGKLAALGDTLHHFPHWWWGGCGCGCGCWWGGISPAWAIPAAFPVAAAPVEAPAPPSITITTSLLGDPDNPE